VYPTGSELTLDVLRNRTASAVGAAPRTPAVAVVDVEAPAGTSETSLIAATGRCEADFAAALAARDADGAARAVLELEAAIHDWSADTVQSDDTDRARAALRSMVVKLAAAASGGLQDPREAAAPFVNALLSLRATVRAEKRYDLSDIIRDRMLEAGVEVRDTKEGVEWVLRGA
jgi:cysteinyl-tRNA synthetase